MKQARLALLLSLALVSVTRAGEPIPLFDGKSLDDWKAEGVSTYEKDGKTLPVWTVSDGAILCNGNGFGFLRYAAREFSDFTFHVEFKMAPKCNSGLGVRTTVFDPSNSRGTRPSYYSYEIQLIDDVGKAPSVVSTGSLYRYIAPNENAMKPAGEWNEIEITCVGSKIESVFNGKKIIDVDQSTVESLKKKPTKGYVCLQNHGGRITFRNVWVKEVEGNRP